MPKLRKRNNNVTCEKSKKDNTNQRFIYMTWNTPIGPIYVALKTAALFISGKQPTVSLQFERGINNGEIATGYTTHSLIDWEIRGLCVVRTIIPGSSAQSYQFQVQGTCISSPPLFFFS